MQVEVNQCKLITLTPRHWERRMEIGITQHHTAILGCSPLLPIDSSSFFSSSSHFPLFSPLFFSFFVVVGSSRSLFSLSHFFFCALFFFCLDVSPVDSSRYTSCESCVEHGWGWSWSLERCGEYINQDCSEEAAAEADTNKKSAAAEKHQHRDEDDDDEDDDEDEDETADEDDDEDEDDVEVDHDESVTDQNRILDLETVKRRIAESAGEHEWGDTDRTTYLWQLVSQNDIDGLKQLLFRNPESIHLRAKDGRGPLFWAYEYNKKAIVRKFIALFDPLTPGNCTLLDSRPNRPHDIFATTTLDQLDDGGLKSFRPVHVVILSLSSLFPFLFFLFLVLFDLFDVLKIDLLIDLGANEEAQDKEGNTPIDLRPR